MKHFKTVPTSNFIFYRSYSRFIDGKRESWEEMVTRCTLGLTTLGELTAKQSSLIRDQLNKCTALPSGRYMWCGGTPAAIKQSNYPGMYNCSSTVVDEIATFGYIMDLAMQGCGTGAVLDLKSIDKLPIVRNKLTINSVNEIGTKSKADRQDETSVNIDLNTGKVEIIVGDSRRGWVDSYVKLIELATTEGLPTDLLIDIDLSNVRSKGEKLLGFGGIANPGKLPQLYAKIAQVLDKSVNRKLTSVECCKLIDEAALVIVAGNIRRSAGIRQFDANDEVSLTAKDNLWQQKEDGSWGIDPERDALRMANHTRIFHKKPTLVDCIESVSRQYYSGEGAIQWAGEAAARASADLLNTPDKKKKFLDLYQASLGAAKQFLNTQGKFTETEELLDDRMARFGTNPCGEIVMNNNFCNLAEIHLNTLDPLNLDEHVRAFTAAALSAVALLKHKFDNPRYQKAREFDPIIGVSFTGLFDFFVNLFGVDWLRWWEAGRPLNWGNPVDVRSDEKIKVLLDADFNRIHHFDSLSDLYLTIEEEYLCFWKRTVFDTVTEYCESHNLKIPNRMTTCQPAGSKSLLTGASAGWHPPKAARYIRRMTFGKNEPLALAAIDLGYSVIPSQSDKDEYGNLLNDIHDERVTEWLVEIPCQTSWADLPGAAEIDISKFSALAQFDFYMQVQKYYATHTTSATIELRQNEIELLAEAIYDNIQKDGGYISAALLARFDSQETFPRLPFEPIDKDRYDQELANIAMRRTSRNFNKALSIHDRGQTEESGPSGCDSDKCLMPERK